MHRKWNWSRTSHKNTLCAPDKEEGIFDTDHKIQRDLAIENAIRFVSKKQIETQQLAIQENERKQAEFREEINRNALFDRILKTLNEKTDVYYQR